MVATPSIDAVEARYGETDIPPTDAERLIDEAVRMTEDLYQDNMLYVSELQGDEDDFAVLLACHKWALREGEPQSENQAGGSVTYNTVTGEVTPALSQTFWGREALGYLRDQPNIGVFREP